MVLSFSTLWGSGTVGYRTSCRVLAHLARCFDAFPDAKVDYGEDEHDAESQLPADGAQVLESLRLVDLQDMAPGVTEKGL